jgi:hypothetical protein
VGLSRVWVQSLADGLVRADQITGIDAHQTPAFAGKPVRWLLDVVLAVPIGNGRRDGWTVSALHRTLIQTAHDPTPATAALARLLAQLDVVNAAGIITASLHHPVAAGATTAGDPARDRRGGEVLPGAEPGAAVAGGVRLRFTAFTEPAPGRHTGAEYL